MLKNKLLLIMINLFFLNPIYAMEISITVDDIPSNGELPQQTERIAIASKILAVFTKHHIKGVYGLLNGEKIDKFSEAESIANRWVQSGHFLGNHTYQHLDLATQNADNYIDNIKKNERALKKLMFDKDYHYFRYPYLSEGNTQEKRDNIRSFLFTNGYKIAPVTVDFFEYEWNDPYVRCLNKNDNEAIAWLKKTYLEQAMNALIISHELSMMLFNRDIKNVLLIHINAMTADMLDDLLTAYEKQGVTFISLKEALSDEVYKINPNVVRDRAYTFLNQVRLSRRLENPDIVDKLYKTLPEDKLNSICR